MKKVLVVLCYQNETFYATERKMSVDWMLYWKICVENIGNGLK